MRQTFRARDRLALSLTAVVAAWTIAPFTGAGYQDPLLVQGPRPAPQDAQASPTPQTPQQPALQMTTPRTRDRVLAIRRARRAGLHYAPGDVIFKFRSGVPTAANNRR